jgi:hypothetical protein
VKAVSKRFLAVLALVAGLVLATHDLPQAKRAWRKATGHPLTWSHPGPFKDAGHWLSKDWDCQVKAVGGPMDCVER